MVISSENELLLPALFLDITLFFKFKFLNTGRSTMAYKQMYSKYIRYSEIVNNLHLQTAFLVTAMTQSKILVE